MALRCRVEPHWDQGGSVALRRGPALRRALPWEAPPGARRATRLQDVAQRWHTSGGAGLRAAIFLAADWPARSHCIDTACGVAVRSAMLSISTPITLPRIQRP